MSENPKKTMKEEWEQVQTELDHNNIEERKFFEMVEADIGRADQLVDHLERKAKINQKATTQEIHLLSTLAKLGILGVHVNSALLGWILAEMGKMAVLLQNEERMKLDVPDSIAARLQKWTEQQEAAEKAWKAYTR